MIVQQKIPQKKKKKKKFYPALTEINIHTNKQKNNLFENNKTNNPQLQQTNDYPYLNIATFNVRGLTIEKRQFILKILDPHLIQEWMSLKLNYPNLTKKLNRI